MTEQEEYEYLQLKAKTAAAAQPQQSIVPDNGFLSRVGNDLNSRAGEFNDILKANYNGQQTAPETVFQLLGKSGFGTLSDVAGEGMRSIGDMAQSIIPDSALSAGANAIDSVMYSRPVQGALQAYSNFAQDDPRAARNLEAAGNMLGVVPIGRALEPAVGAANAAKTSAIDLKNLYLQKLAEQSAKAEPQSAASGFAGISGAPSETVAPLNEIANLATEDGGVIRLPKGVKDKDINSLRVQEQARQGVLGPDAEAQVRGIDKAVTDDTKSVVQSLVGNTTTDSPDELLARGINAYKQRAEAVKKVASDKIQKRNEALSKANIYADYTRDTLGKKVAGVVEDPQNSVFFETSDSAPINERLKLLNKYIGNEEPKAIEPKVTVDPFTGQRTVQEAKPPVKKAIDFNKLQGWSSEMSALARANQGKPVGVIANKMVGQYNDWLDNITREAFKEGDEDIVQTIMDANKNYAAFKQKYGKDTFAGRSNVVNDILQKDELTPEQLVNMVFGNSVKGKAVTGQIVDRMVSNMPEGPRREAMVNDMRSGLIMRAFKKAETQDGSLKMQTLANELTNLLNSPAYKRNLASAQHDKTIRALAADINRYQRAINDPSVRSTSGTGGVVGRIWNGVANVMQSAPVRHMSAGGSQVLSDLARKAAAAGSRAELRKIEKEFFKNVGGAANEKKTVYGATASPKTK